MTYALFLALFVAPFALLSVWAARRLFDANAVATFAVLLVVVYAAAYPWDNAAVGMGLWSFSESQTLPFRLGHLPLEECAFFGLQTLLTGPWVWRRLHDV